MTKVRRISVVLITIGLWSCDDPSERSSAADIQSMTSSPTDVAGISAQLAAGRPSGLGNVTSLGVDWQTAVRQRVVFSDLLPSRRVRVAKS